MAGSYKYFTGADSVLDVASRTAVWHLSRGRERTLMGPLLSDTSGVHLMPTMVLERPASTGFYLWPGDTSAWIGVRFVDPPRKPNARAAITYALDWHAAPLEFHWERMQLPLGLFPDKHDADRLARVVLAALAPLEARLRAVYPGSVPRAAVSTARPWAFADAVMTQP